jgi:hypothetical protein
MPMLNVAFVALSPMFATRFSVERRDSSVDDYGVGQTTSVVTSGVVGTIVPASNNLERRDDSSSSARGVDVYTKFHLRASSATCQPDRVIWQGETYTVTGVDPFTHLGAGFVRARAEVQSAHVVNF